MKSQKIAIVGAGTAGLSCAVMLARQGHLVSLFEKAESFKPVGTGVLLQPCGLDVLSEMGLLPPILRYGQRIDSLYGENQSRRAIMQVSYSDLLNQKADIFGLGLHRASLCHVLASAFAATNGTVHFGCEVRSTEQHGDRQLLHFVQNSQQHSEAFDSVLIANGSTSQLRPAHWVKYDKQYPWGAMWAIVPLTEQLAFFDQPCLRQRYEKAHTMVGMLPTGCRPDNPDQRMVSLFWSLPVSEIPQFCAGSFDFAGWKIKVATVWPELTPLLDTWRDSSKLMPATYRDVVLSHWGQGRLGVIGDAAHAMSPQLGQGTNMALLDAHAIANAVDRATDWGEVWRLFHKQRASSIRFYQSMSRLLTPMFQSRIPGIAQLRDIVLPLSYKLPWLRSQMAQTVAGSKNGLLN